MKIKLLAIFLMASAMFAERHIVPDIPAFPPSSPTAPLMEGVVVLNATIDVDGAIQKIIRMSGNEALARGAMAHLKTCRFMPASPDDPKNPTYSVTYIFHADSGVAGRKLEFKPEANTFVVTFSPPPAPTIAPTVTTR